MTIDRGGYRYRLALGKEHIPRRDLVRVEFSIRHGDPGFGFRPGGAAFKHVGGQSPAQGLRNLTAAGIVDTNKRDSLHNTPRFLFDYLKEWMEKPLS